MRHIPSFAIHLNGSGSVNSSEAVRIAATVTALRVLDMSQLTLFHNPRCSKSRGALELLEARGLNPDIVRYLETPPSAAELKALLGKLGIGARQLLRTGEEEYKSLGLADPDLGEDALIQAMVEHPRLIERPILIAGDKAVIGRPPEKVLEILP
ncbi:Arsenate reductase [compost metagenome]